jgi:hypothetical protein
LSTQRPDTALYFNEVAALGRNRVYLAGHLYKYEGTSVELTRLMKYEDGKWGTVGDVEGIARALRVVEDPTRRLLVLCTDGLLWERSSAGVKQEEIPIRKHGQLFDLKKIGSAFHACGVQHQVFRHTGTGWVPHDQGIYSPMGKTVDRMFMAMDGTAENDIYCVGMGGALAHHDGTRWTSLESPTNYTLNLVSCRSREQIFIAGAHGVFFHGQPGRWTFAGLQGSEHAFVGMAWFQERLYLSNRQRLYVFNGKDLEEVDTGLGQDVLFYRLSATETDLWVTSGRDDILHFDGRTWERLVSPESLPRTP